MSNGKTLRVPNFRFFIGGVVTFTLGPWSSLLGGIPDKNDHCAFPRKYTINVFINMYKGGHLFLPPLASSRVCFLNSF
jgi:hypothetical protein